MSRINTNVSSLVAQNTLNRSNADLQQALRRLSTGLKINTGKDDPAGLIASENLRRDITAIDKAISNSERASQVIATADSALGQVSKLLNDVRGLVTEAANRGALSDEQIAANQLQVDSSLEAIDRIAQTTAFQGRKLLDGSLDFIFSEGTGYSSVAGLQINKANLGAAGSMEVNVDITAAASKALITNAIPSSAAGQFTLDGKTFTIQATPASNLNSVTVALDKRADDRAFGKVDIDGHTFNIAAATGQLTNTAGVTVTTAQADNAARGTVTIDQTDFTITAAAGTGFDNAAVKIATADLGLAQNVSTVTADKVRFTQNAGANGIRFNIAANAGRTNLSTHDGITVTFAIAALSGADTVEYNAGTKTLAYTIDNTVGGGDRTAAAIAGVINGYQFGGGQAFTVTNAEDVGAGMLGAGGGITAANNVLYQEQARASYAAAANELTITLNSNAEATVTSTGTARSVDAIVAGVTEIATATASGPINVDPTGLNGTTVGTLVRPTVLADFSAGPDTLTLTFDDNNSQININDVITAIDGLTQFAGTTSQSSSGTINGITFTPGSTANALTRLTTGVKADFNSTSSTLTLIFDGSNSAVLTSDLISAVDGLTEFENTALTAGSGPIDARNLTSSNSLATAARVQDVVMRIGGEWGTEVFSFQAGTTFEQIAAAIQSVSDATGVTAEVVGSELKLGSVNYGSKAFVDVEVIREGTGGTFKANLSDKRATGADVQASVNGVVAKGDGNTLSVNTATLDMALTVADGSTTDVAFTINGGGALFQLGPTVVSNQQARLSIDSIATGQLGGATGRLYELRSGNARALASDATGAARIVDEAINSVVGLRGRLGAFQRTSLDTNIASLQDTMVNLTSAESAIRDADFAKESAAMTRAQILVQSGTAVLSIANQNPQQVLALLR